VSGRIRERIDDVEQLDHGSRPPVRDDHRQRIRVLRLDVDEVNVDAVDLGHELRVGIELGLGLPPVVVRRPVMCERLERRKLDALGPISDELLGGPARGRDPFTKLNELFLRDVHPKRPDGRVVVLGCGGR
jgi:hypothetical protein